jgi:hypothetical protein
LSFENLKTRWDKKISLQRQYWRRAL